MMSPVIFPTCSPLRTPSTLNVLRNSPLAFFL
jgi:hypothetical protein